MIVRLLILLVALAGCSDYAYVEYDHGYVGAKAFRNDEGLIVVVTCYEPADQPDGKEESWCWDRTITDDGIKEQSYGTVTDTYID